MPRTGSTYLEQILINCDGIRSCGEPFNKPRSADLPAEWLDGIRKLTQLDIQDHLSWHAWKIEHPGLFLENEYQLAKMKIAFKLFPLHLSREMIDRDIFSRKDIFYILLKRRPIESFISDRKAATLKAWRDVDTTDLKPTLPAKRFMEWAEYYSSWYAWLEKRLTETEAPFVRMGYEKHLRHSETSEAVAAVLEALKPLGLDDSLYSPKITLMDQQDKEERYQNRCANWEQFHADVIKLPNGPEMMKWAETID
jgi:hypothetical protein